MVINKIGRYSIFGSNGFYLIGRWDGQEYRAMHSVPTYTTMKGAIKKVKKLQKEDNRKV